MPEEKVATEQFVARIFSDPLRRLEDREHVFVSLDIGLGQWPCYTSDNRTLVFVEAIFAHLQRPRKRGVFFVVDVHDDPGTSVAGDMYAELRPLVWNASRTALEDLQGNLEMVIERVEEKQGRTRFKIALTGGPLAVPTPTHIHVSMRTS